MLIVTAVLQVYVPQEITVNSTFNNMMMFKGKVGVGAGVGVGLSSEIRAA